MAKQRHVWGAASCMQWRSSGCAGFPQDDGSSVGPSKHVAQGEILEKGRAPLGAAYYIRLYAYLVLRAYMVSVLFLLCTMICIWPNSTCSFPMSLFSHTSFVLLQPSWNANPCGDPPRTRLPHLALKA